MLTLKQQMQSYGAYHRDPRNKLTHFFGVPLVTFSLFLFFGWFRFVHPEVLPITAATLFYLGVTVYYFRLDWTVALMQLPPSRSDTPLDLGLGREPVHGAVVLGVPDDLRARVDHPARRPRDRGKAAGAGG